MRTVKCLALAMILAIAAALPGSPATAAPPAGEHRGTLAGGATWLGHIPDDWNGTVLLFAHGFGPLRPQDAPSDRTRELLLAEGYAMVGSSYSGPTMWALETAENDQYAALRAFEQILGTPPRRTIAIGRSMGGLVSARQAHHPRGGIDGVLTTCGIVAGGLNLNNYQLDGLHALSELLAPGRTIPLVRYDGPEQAAQAAADILAVTTEAQASPQGRARIALAAALFNLSGGTGDPAGQQQRQFLALTAGGALNRYVTARQQIELSAGGNSAYNRGVDYRALLTGSVHSAQVRALYREAGLDLRADLDRLTATADVTADPWAVADLRRSSMVNGPLRVPHLTIHTLVDELVPVEHVAWYGAHTRHRPDLFRSLYVNAIGHCAFQPADDLAALHLLEARLDTGRWPRIVPYHPGRLVGGLGEPGRL
ncbi:alpha/beta hydrolase [Actinoplanes lobatus]|uniref:Alpha/beta hydrolase n=1 Tax=Actinoplanes lobatus TaxID=113568 RepID=A0A7W7MKL5_9ACTN|nr:alpha/beta hydrolase [Actinoplanes lobatus]MBB4753481.1 hypothetical protein [Actinoplanes lobatus]GGN91888.1 alpha/beta hydrolase [Actinoplanes lobatus]GIE38015.1 alpha/beta hydrolase [Actinoplanes lobatus]